MCNNTREKKLRHWLPAAAVGAWGSVTASERGERQSVSGAKAVSFESNLSHGPYWRSHTELYGHLWTLTHARGCTATLCLHVRACVHGLRPTGRRTDGADAAVRRRRTLHMLNYMLLTVVANGHNCVATATAGYAQGRFQDFTLVATEAECPKHFFA